MYDPTTQQAMAVIAQILRRIPGPDAHLTLAQQPVLLITWAALHPETRRDLILATAWKARNAHVNGGDSISTLHVREFVRAAKAWAERPDGCIYCFCRPMHPAYSLASSLAFDPDDIHLSLLVTLILTALIPPAGDDR